MKKLKKVIARKPANRGVSSTEMDRSRKAVRSIIDAIKESESGWALFDAAANPDYNVKISISVHECRELLWLKRWLGSCAAGGKAVERKQEP